MPPSTAARLTSGSAPMPCARRCAIARPTSCSSGWNKPGATTNTIAHNPFSAANADVESWWAARIWNP